jgi:hypothetical protein
VGQAKAEPPDLFEQVQQQTPLRERDVIDSMAPAQ